MLDFHLVLKCTKVLKITIFHISSHLPQVRSLGIMTLSLNALFIAQISTSDRRWITSSSRTYILFTFSKAISVTKHYNNFVSDPFRGVIPRDSEAIHHTRFPYNASFVMRR